MTLGTILVVVLIVFLFGSFFNYGGRFADYGYGFGNRGVGAFGILLLLVLALLITGNMH